MPLGTTLAACTKALQKKSRQCRDKHVKELDSVTPHCVPMASIPF